MSDLPRAAVGAGIRAIAEHPSSVTVAGLLAAAVRDENGEPCPLCEGEGKIMSRSSRQIIDCGFCGGVGKVWVLKAGPA